MDNSGKGVLNADNEDFNTAKKPLNFISEHYLHYRRSYLFGVEAY
ncbi:MAG TPA: hypothetical protein VEF34_17855 [Syntrophobacteraceae bacterium]|nr:hypothetical protein [Syntrophobacteraceae bacterium]